MKKMILIAATLFSFVTIGQCVVRQSSDNIIGPATATGDIAIAAAGTSKINCLEYLIAFSTSAYTVRILNGNTTAYAMSQSASIGHNAIFGFTPICSSTNTAMTLKATPDTDAGASVQLNYNGFIHKN